MEIPIRKYKKVEILLVEDNPADIRLTTEGFKDLEIEYEVYVANNGEDALDFIWKRNGYETAPRPDLILLDLNLPKIDGRTVLEKIKTDEEVRTIPVVVLTTSKNEEDIQRAYELHANAYVQKPISFERFLEMIRHIFNFWFATVTLPEV